MNSFLPFSFSKGHFIY